jgi:CBS domain-containing protein
MPATVGTVASPIVVTATPETSAAQAARLMREHHVGSLVVIDTGAVAGKPVGIVTDRDLVLAVMAEGLDASLFTVGDVMSTDLATVAADATLLVAIERLRARRLRRLIVTDSAGRVVGLAAFEDLLEALVGELGTLAQALRGARDRERKERR